jgi:hypothetical protein
VALLSLQNITLSFGGPTIFNGINLQLEASASRVMDNQALACEQQQRSKKAGRE